MFLNRKPKEQRNDQDSDERNAIGPEQQCLWHLTPKLHPDHYHHCFFSATMQSFFTFGAFRNIRAGNLGSASRFPGSRIPLPRSNPTSSVPLSTSSNAARNSSIIFFACCWIASGS